MKNKFVENALKTGVPFGIAMGAYEVAQHGLLTGVIIAPLVGAGFGLTMASQMGRQGKLAERLRPNYEAEGIVRDGPASAGMTGGWLCLTKQRLVFETTKGTKKRFDLPLSKIADVKKPLVGNQIEIVAAGDQRHRIVVQDGEVWIALIRHTATSA